MFNVIYSVNLPVRHSLPSKRLYPKFGSHVNGHCTPSPSGDGNICNGTSELNNGIIPALSGVSNDTQSQWASQLFTLRRNSVGTARIILSFEVEHATYDRLELTVFNCPEMGIYTPRVNVYVDDSFRPGRDDRGVGNIVVNRYLLNTSCDHLVNFCVMFNDSLSASYFNLEFPHQNNLNSHFVFLGEVTFLDSGMEPCDPPKLITEALILLPLSEGNAWAVLIRMATVNFRCSGF